jgi:hypothetical protein
MFGGDTDTTAAIYGQIAGAYYGIDGIPSALTEQLYAFKSILGLGRALWEVARDHSVVFRKFALFDSNERIMSFSPNILPPSLH